MAERSPHLRPREGAEQRTTAFELFFDLVYVFAVTQLSHLVIDGNLRLDAIGRAAFLLLVVWWAWIYTTWMVNWFDPRSVAVRAVLSGVALASLLMSAAIPTAFKSHAILFAVGYVALQLGRDVAALLLLQRGEPLRPVFERIVVWCLASSVLWLAGALAPGSARLALWGPALAVDLVAPLVGYRTPWLGRSSTTDWDVEGAHFADRFQGFLIIALGESIVVTGATASSHGLSSRVTFALVIAVVITGALWWLYFDEVAEHAQRNIAEAEDPGRLARDAYTYLHLPIVTGIIMVAVADDLLIAHPDHRLATAGVIMTVAGPAVYLLGESLVRLRMISSLSPQRLLAVAALALLGVLGRDLPASWLSVGVALILVGLTIWDHERIRPSSGPFAWISVGRAKQNDVSS
ncbi:MAG TPA: low temperature requirement protein A [Solirubrobacteraceae bacterium]|nr:low temperature requirement protein A [Solirubrobacteraceae bacterium]